jgi:integrase
MAALGRDWRDADNDDLDDVREWRVTSEDNPRPVEDGTWERQVSVLRSLYWFAGPYGIPSPIPPNNDVDSDLGGAYVKSANVKWFDPEAYLQWRDVGLGGLLPDGAENRSFRGRNVQRDMAFANALYRTGLRVQECGSVLLGLEWPDQRDSSRDWRTVTLAGQCAKGGYSRRYRVPGVVVADTCAYLLGERSRAVERGRVAYATRDDLLIITQVSDAGTLAVVDRNGVARSLTLNTLTPAQRLRLFWDRGDFLEPAMLWLNVDGQPRDHRSWNRTFTRANARVRDLGLPLATMKPHYLRHSFALRWFAVAKILWDRRLVGLTEDQADDLRAELGSHWNLVKDMLGHRNLETTQRIYLEPFTGLDVDLLFEHTADESVASLLSSLFQQHPRVQSAIAS